MLFVTMVTKSHFNEYIQAAAEQYKLIHCQSIQLTRMDNLLTIVQLARRLSLSTTPKYIEQAGFHARF